MTIKTRNTLARETLLSINQFAKLSGNVRKVIDEANSAKNDLTDVDPKELRIINNIIRLNEYTLLLILVFLDLATAFRIYINAIENYEVIYSAKQIIVTINEGFKKIYNFVSFDISGNQKTKNRNNSFWIKDIGSIVHKELHYLLDDYKILTDKLDNYIDEDLELMKNQRDLTVHYDHSPSMVYDMLIGLDIEKVSIKTVPFLGILSEMINFTNLVYIEYDKLIKSIFIEANSNRLKLIEDLKVKLSDDPEKMLILGEYQDFIMRHMVNIK